VPEPTQKYELSPLRACSKVDISWDGPQFLCISLCRSLVKSLSYPISDHADKLILAETVFNFYALACAQAYSKVWVIPSQGRKIDISWDGLQFLCISLCRSLLKSMSYPISDHAEKLILAEMVFNFYALVCAGAYSKVWVIPSQTMQKNWHSLSWGLQFLCITLCRSLLKSMSHPISEHAEQLILAETVFNFYALACGEPYSKVWVIPSQTMQKNWYQLRRCSISMH
jgi:hypothetical protein